MRTPIELVFHAPHAPGGPLDGLRGACDVEFIVRAEAGTLCLPGSSLPVAWLPGGEALPPGQRAAFWGLVVQRPEMLHRLLWLMSDHGLPRSFRTLALHGRGTWRLTDAAGRARLARWQALPLAGLQSLLRDEAERLAGVFPDVHGRELRAALAAGAPVGFELALQVFDADEAAAFPFDVLDATTLVPEELVPLRYAGRIVVERVLDDVPDRGPAAAEAAPGPDDRVVPVAASAPGRDQEAASAASAPGLDQETAIAASAPGLERVAPARRGGDPFAQAALFWRSQSAVEQRHLVAALRVALVREAAPALREALVALFGHVDAALARRVADGLGFAPPEPPPRPGPAGGAVESTLPAGASAGLSLFARPGDGRVAGRRVALLVAEGVEAESLQRAQRLLRQAQVLPCTVAARLGQLSGADGARVAVDTTFDAEPSVCWDALVLPDGVDALPRLCADGRVLAFVREQYRHAKPILLLGRDAALLRAAGIPLPAEAADDPGLVFPPPPPDDEEEDELPGALPDADAGPPLPLSADEAEALLRRFIGALARHRHFERELDPPLV